MIYGHGYWNVENGVRLAVRTYPSTRGFEYKAVDPKDRTGDCGEFLLKNWCFDYIPPGETGALRFTIEGNPEPVLHKNSFDFDWASIPRLLRGLTCDKADYRIRAGCLPHDMGFCVHEFWPGFNRAFWNRMLFEIMEAYSVTREEVAAAQGWKERVKLEWRYARDLALRSAVWAGVTAGGPFVWKKTEEERERYGRMLSVQRVEEWSVEKAEG